MSATYLLVTISVYKKVLYSLDIQRKRINSQVTLLSCIAFISVVLELLPSLLWASEMGLKTRLLPCSSSCIYADNLPTKDIPVFLSQD